MYSIEKNLFLTYATKYKKNDENFHQRQFIRYSKKNVNLI